MLGDPFLRRLLVRLSAALTAEVLRTEPVRCTGLGASWCPIHGECNCHEDPITDFCLDRWDCPLHGRDSTHANPSRHKVEA